MPTEQLPVRVPSEIKDRIITAARTEGRSTNNLVNLILREWLDNYTSIPIQPVDYEKGEEK